MRNACLLPLALCAAVHWAAVADAACTVANATLAFGSYNPVSVSPTTANTTVTVRCSAAVISTNRRLGSLSRCNAVGRQFWHRHHEQNA